MARTANPTVRATILGAARTAFQHKGYMDTRMTDIAALAHVAVGTIYLYFDTKEALILALVDDFHQQLHQEAIPPWRQGDFATAIATALHLTLQIMHEQRDLLTMVYLQMGLAALPEPSTIEVQVTQALTAVLEERIGRGEARPFDAEKTAQLIIGLVEQAALVHAIEGEASMPQLEATLVRFVQHALIPDPKET